MDMTGFADGAPTRVGVAITDYLAGLYAIQGILLALHDRHAERPRAARRHRAVRRDAVGDAAAAVGAAGDRRRSDARRQRPPEHRAVRAAPREGRPDHRRGREPAAVGSVLRRDRAPGPARRSAVRDQHGTGRQPRGAQARRSKRRFSRSRSTSWAGGCRRRTCPCGRVRSMREAIAHPQVAARDILLQQQRADIGAVETLAPVVRLSRTPAEVRLPPPALGEHTAEILKGLGLGIPGIRIGDQDGSGITMFQPDLLKNRVALITGGGTGICRGIALAFARMAAMWRSPAARSSISSRRRRSCARSASARWRRRPTCAIRRRSRHDGDGRRGAGPARHPGQRRRRQLHLPRRESVAERLRHRRRHRSEGHVPRVEGGAAASEGARRRRCSTSARRCRTSAPSGSRTRRRRRPASIR